MKFILTVFFFLMPMMSYAHNMPDQAKKDALIEVMVKYGKPFYGIAKEEFENGSFKTSFAETHLIPLVNVFEWGRTGYDDVGDQDLEEFHFTFKHEGIEYTLNCLLDSVEELAGARVKYTLDTRYCILSSQGTDEEISIPTATVYREEPY